MRFVAGHLENGIAFVPIDMRATTEICFGEPAVPWGRSGEFKLRVRDLQCGINSLIPLSRGPVHDEEPSLPCPTVSWGEVEI